MNPEHIKRLLHDVSSSLVAEKLLIYADSMLYALVKFQQFLYETMQIVLIVELCKVSDSLSFNRDWFKG